MATQNEFGLFTIAALYGLGFSGIIPAYVVAIRELFPSREASWRVPTVLFVSMGGMAFGSWWAGALFDHFGYYGPAFVTGALFNLANLAVVGFLVLRQRRQGAFPARPLPELHPHTAKPYSRATLPRVIWNTSSGFASLKSRATTSCECGQDDAWCG